MSVHDALPKTFPATPSSVIVENTAAIIPIPKVKIPSPAGRATAGAVVKVPTAVDIATAVPGFFSVFAAIWLPPGLRRRP